MQRILSGWVIVLVLAGGASIPAGEPSKPAASEKGLTGILPDAVPADLSAEAFGVLGGNWEQWGKDVSSQVAAFYEKRPADPAAQRALIDNLQQRLDVMNKALGDSSYAQIFDPLVVLSGRLARRVEVTKAILDVLEQSPDVQRQDRLAAARRGLADSAQVLRNYLTTLDNGGSWAVYTRLDELSRIAGVEQTSPSEISVLDSVAATLQADQTQLTAEQAAFLGRPPFVELRRALESYVDATRAQRQRTPADEQHVRTEFKRLVAALEGSEQDNSSARADAVRGAYSALRKASTYDMTPVVDALRLHYFNYNLRVVATERFLQRLIGEQRHDTGPVDDFILGAKVDGQQWTRSQIGIDLRPSQSAAEFDITLNGMSQTSTQGVTDQAVIYTSGYHQFWAAKQVTFDGEVFATAPARISVDANNTTTGASTDMNGVPIFGGIARRIAVRESRKKRPQSEAIAVDRVSRRVLPEFNGEVDKEFSKANDDLGKKVVVGLKDADLYPTSCNIRTTDDALLVRTQLMGAAELAGGLHNSSSATPTGIVMQIHESLINNSLDRMKLAGRTISDKGMAEELEKTFSRILGRPFKFSELKSNVKTSQDTGEDEGPTTLMFAKSDPIRVKIENGAVNLTIRTGLKQEAGKEDIPTQVITVPLEFRIEGDNLIATRGQVSVSPVEPPASRVTQIARAGVVRKKIQAALPERKTDRYLHIQRKGQEPLAVAVTSVKALDGWLSLVIE